jgi:Domain of unknown function (DUF1877)
MGFDCSYQGIPSNSEIIQIAYNDPGFAENVFYSVVGSARYIEKSPFFKDKDHDPIRELFILNPNIKNWNYYPISRMQDALIYTLDPDSYNNSSNYDELSNTLPFKVVMGNEVFCNHLHGIQGIPVRFSYPVFVKECAEYLTKIKIEVLSENFDAPEMARRGIYKVSEYDKFQFVEIYFTELLVFYKEMASYDNVSVFVSKD